MYAYLVRFFRVDESDDSLIELPSLWRLLLWLITHAHQCRSIHILKYYKQKEAHTK